MIVFISSIAFYRYTGRARLVAGCLQASLKTWLEMSVKKRKKRRSLIDRRFFDARYCVRVDVKDVGLVVVDAADIPGAGRASGCGRRVDVADGPGTSCRSAAAAIREETADLFSTRADRALYMTKNKGRNCISAPARTSFINIRMHQSAARSFFTSASDGCKLAPSTYTKLLMMPLPSLTPVRPTKAPKVDW